MPATKNKKAVIKNRVRTKPKAINRSRVQKQGFLARAPRLSKPVMALVAGLVVLVGAFVVWMAFAATPADYTPAGIATKGLDPTGKTLPSFDYPVPTSGRVVYMAPTDKGGSDANDGLALDRPVETITRAYNQLKSGGNTTGTIVLRGGEYRSWYSTDGKIAAFMSGNITFQAYRSEKPWFVGSDPIKDGWTQASAGVWKRAWSTPNFCTNHENASSGQNYRTKVPRLDGALVSPITVGTSDGVKPYSASSGISMSAPRVCAHPDNYYSRTDQAFDIDSDPQLAVVNGSQIPQKKTLAELSTSPNSFYYDWDNEVIYVNKDPNANNVELARRKEIAVFAGATKFQWKGIGVKYFASSPLRPIIYAGLGGAGNPNGGELIVENSVFSENSAGTIGISGPKLGSAVRNSVFANNGYTGLGLNGFATSNDGAPTGFVIDSSIFSNNNRANLDVACGASCGAAAVKLNNMSGYTVKNSIFESTQGRAGGLWCDIDCSGAVMVNNVVRNNTGPGIFYEISSKGIIANNLIYDNRTAGIQSFASEMKIYNNTIVNKDGGNVEAVWIMDDNRPAPDKGETWPYTSAEEQAAVTKLCANAGQPSSCQIGSPGPNTNRVEFANNLIVGQPNPGARLANFGNNGIPYAPNTTSQDYFSVLDYNAYYHKASQNLYRWLASDSPRTPELLRSTSGQQWELNAIQVTDSTKAPDPFVDRGGRDYRLKADSLAATSKGKSLPADVAAAIGVAAGTNPVRGVIFPATSIPTTTTTTTTPSPTPDTTAPAGPSSLSATATSTSQINLSWPAASDGVGVANYVLTRNGTQIYTGTSLSFSDTGLNASTSYAYKVVAKDAAGNPSTGATATGTTQAAPSPTPTTTPTPTPTPDTTKPSQPTSAKGKVEFDALKFTYFTNLVWSPSYDNIGVTNYEVKRNSVSLGTTTTPNFKDYNLQPNILYTYDIYARDAAGNISAPGATRLTGRCFLIWCWSE